MDSVHRIKIDMADKEAMERGARTCWNKFSRWADKFSELIFIISLVTISLWNFLIMFQKDKKFSFVTLMLCIYYLLLALMIYKSWKADITFLMYFGFMRGRISKTLFLVFCACLTLPRDENFSMTNNFLHWSISLLLCAAAMSQLFKYCNKDEEKEMLLKEQQDIEGMK